jgi:hypothetical protein
MEGLAAALIDHMHRLPSRYAVTRFKLASWAVFIMHVMIPTTSGVLIYSVVVMDEKVMELALALIFGTTMLAIIQWSASRRACCPLCHARSISHSGCSKHRNARTLFGSYRLRVACAVIFREYFRCPYCGESTAVKARPPALPRRRSQ